MNVQREMIIEPAAGYSSAWFGGAAFGITACFVLAVTIAGWTVNTAYQSSHLELRERTALAKQKVLQERLAQANSLQVVHTFALNEGFIPTVIAGSIDTALPVADNSLAQ